MALRRLLLSALTGIALVGAGSAPPAAALPVGGSSRDLDELHRWSSGPETTVRYYNVCNDNLNEIEYESDERFGVVYDPVSTGELYETWWYFFLSSGTGYGSACTIDVMRSIMSNSKSYVGRSVPLARTTSPSSANPSRRTPWRRIAVPPWTTPNRHAASR